MSAEALIFTYTAAGLGFIAAAGIYYERRQKLFTPAASEDTVFRCEKCNFVYTDDMDVDRSRCPHCGRINEPFAF
jgi:rubrerythrin